MYRQRKMATSKIAAYMKESLQIERQLVLLQLKTHSIIPHLLLLQSFDADYKIR